MFRGIVLGYGVHVKLEQKRIGAPCRLGPACAHVRTNLVCANQHGQDQLLLSCTARCTASESWNSFTGCDIQTDSRMTRFFVSVYIWFGWVRGLKSLLGWLVW